MAEADAHTFGMPVASHAWNGDRTMVAVCQGADVIIYQVGAGPGSSGGGGSWEKVSALQKHEQTVSGVDWAPKSDRIVTCSHDRNAYVWQRSDETGEWKPTLVHLRLSRAALCVAWSPLENKFAVGSGARTASVCYYDAENNWWVSKVIRKKHASSVTSVAWHPANSLLATTSTDNKCRIFSAHIKGVDPKATESGSSSSFSTSKFGEQLLQLDLAFGWAFGVTWSPSGANLAFAGHDSSIHFINDVGPSLSLHSLPLPTLPLRDISFLSDTLAVAAGFDCNPMLFSSDPSTGAWSFVRFLDEAKDVGRTPKTRTPRTPFGERLAGPTTFDSPRRATPTELPGTPGATGGASSFAWEDTHRPHTVHTNCIMSIHSLAPPDSAAEEGIAEAFSTSGLDGRLVVWDISGLHLSHALRSLRLDDNA